jgi:hypothetical protein
VTLAIARPLLPARETIGHVNNPSLRNIESSARKIYSPSRFMSIVTVIEKNFAPGGRRRPGANAANLRATGAF